MIPPGANATATGGGLPDPSLCSPPVVSPTPDERSLLAILRRHQGRANAITQEAAGREMGFGGGVDTIRRRVQKVRERLMQGGHFVCATSANPAGMWLPVSDAEIDEYCEHVKGRALSTLRTVSMADRLRGRRMLEEIQQELGLGFEGDRPSEMRARICWCGCRETFEPVRKWQRFKNQEHKRSYESSTRSVGVHTASTDGTRP